MELQGVKSQELQGVQCQRLHEETYQEISSRNFFNSAAYASRLPVGRRSAAARIPGACMEDRTFNGQQYKFVELVPHTRTDGSATELAVWSSACADCGELFEVRTPARSKKFIPNRRCTIHKRPGVRVRVA